MTVAGLLLAAGAGRRFGSPKALVELGGELLVDRGARLLAAGGCTPVVVVLGAAADEVLARTSLTDVVVATDWAAGISASLRAGLADLTARDVAACVVALADQPGVSPDAVARLLAAHRAGAVAAMATYAGEPRNPVLLSRDIWADVAATAVGDVGARQWLRSHPDVVVAVPCDDAGTAFDVDTPEDLAALD